MEPTPTPRPNHVLRNNLLLVLVAAVVLGLLGRFVAVGAAFLFAGGYLVQVLVNVVLGVVRLVKAEPGRSAAPYFLSALLVLIIGFGACSVMVLAGLDTMN
ncbi:hypothetical protein FY528_01960 [Hymenobacter lutimineralis]|uniref:Uncharacterized protein n=1 Tax=Hymenobacter lutimineralis TaxID=2606448 RepID=A0A5D6VG70_9BACT|nr:hypothetical protein [Hymenobacter lutimineralis]TYZ14516.1 hypothetical protein FY528_01960 [Hymenobacter lutimineralis]